MSLPDNLLEPFKNDKHAIVAEQLTSKKEILFSDKETTNSKQLDILKKYFPQCFDKQGHFIQERMLEVVNGHEIELSKESYSLNWLGKSYARLLANLPPNTLLTEDNEHNQKPENKDSQNLLIKGDNLEVLKHLVNAYTEKVKMIYIDPPYNTGSDGFAYNDDRKFTKEQLSELAGIDLDEAGRILDFTGKGSSSHSAWLTFIYPRLYIARELLSEDGVALISIDNNEVAQLKIICNEIFGENNILGIIANINNPKGRSDDAFIATAHEYLFIVSKNKSKARTYGFDPEEKITKRYNKTDSNGKKYREIDLRKTGDEDKREDREDMFYYFYYDKSSQRLTVSNKKESSKNKIEIIPIRDDGSDGRWRWGFDTAKKRLNDIYPKFMPNRKIWGIMEKDYLDGRPPVKPTSAWTHKDVNSERGSEQFIELGFNKDCFPKPKPLGTIERAIKIGIPPNEKAIILDFFAGSGTTAHAVFKMNQKTHTKTTVILVQLPENCSKNSAAYKAGYKTIFDITKDRIIKSAQKIKQENPDYKGDLGFKIFETTDDFRVTTDEELILSNLTMFDNVVLNDEQYHTLLTTWSLYDGRPLTKPVENLTLANYPAHYCNGNLYFIAPDFNADALKALLQKLDKDPEFTPHKIVYYGSNFDSARQMELNEAMKSYANKKSLELDVVVRY